MGDPNGVFPAHIKGGEVTRKRMRRYIDSGACKRSSNKRDSQPHSGTGIALSRGRVFRGFEPGTLDHGNKKDGMLTHSTNTQRDTSFEDRASISTWG